jgi:hypothetical protein
MMAKTYRKFLPKMSFLFAAISIMCGCDLRVRLGNGVFGLLESLAVPHLYRRLT